VIWRECKITAGQGSKLSQHKQISVHCQTGHDIDVTVVIVIFWMPLSTRENLHEDERTLEPF
jgi:hypothetical protein